MNEELQKKIDKYIDEKLKDKDLYSISVGHPDRKKTISKTIGDFLERTKLRILDMALELIQPRDYMGQIERQIVIKNIGNNYGRTRETIKELKDFGYDDKTINKIRKILEKSLYDTVQEIQRKNKLNPKEISLSKDDNIFIGYRLNIDDMVVNYNSILHQLNTTLYNKTIQEFKRL